MTPRLRDSRRSLLRCAAMRNSTFAWALVLLAACGGGRGGAADGGGDAASEAGADVGVEGGFDAGPECVLACEAPRVCCVGDDGEPTCVDTRNDSRHCGRCGASCEPEQGTSCVEGRCACGRITIGCEGSRGNLCCPGDEARPEPYCANLLADAANCGGCGQVCDGERSDFCLAGECACGDERRLCDEGQRCCPDFGGASSGCVDPVTDREHCGGCGNRCRAGFDCVAGVCRSRRDAGSEAELDGGLLVDAGADGGTEPGDDAGLDGGAAG